MVKIVFFLSVCFDLARFDKANEKETFYVHENKNI